MKATPALHLIASFAFVACGQGPSAFAPDPHPSASVPTPPPVAADPCFENARTIVCPARPTPTADPTPWPRPSQLVDTRPIRIEQPVTVATFATLAHRDEVLPKLDAAQRDSLVAAEAAFAAAALDDAKWPTAKTAFEKFLKAPSAAGDLEGYARSMWARALWLHGDSTGARVELERVITLADRPSAGSRELADHARRELVLLHARSSDAGSVYDAIRHLAPAGPSGEPAAIEMLAGIAREALRIGERERAVKLYEELLARNGHGDAACGYEVGRAAAQLSIAGNQKRSLETLERLLVAALRKARAIDDHRGSVAYRACTSEMIALGTAFATRLQIEALGGRRDERGTFDRRTLRFAKDLYELLLVNFNQADLDAAQLDMPASARPSVYRMKHAVADIHWFEKDPTAGPLYDELIAMRPDAPDAVEMIYRAAAGRRRIDERSYDMQKLEPSERRELTDVEAARVLAYEQLICLGEPPRASTQAYNVYVGAKLDRGVTFLAASQRVSAALAFRDVALRHPDHEKAWLAGWTYLRALQLVLTDQPACAPHIESDARTLFDLDCRSQGVGHGDWQVLGNYDSSKLSEMCRELRTLSPTIPPAVQVDVPPLPPVEHEARPPQIRFDGTSVSGRLPVEVVEHVVRRSLGGVTGCYEMGLRRDPELEGQMIVEFSIGTGGATSAVNIRASDTLVSTKVVSCVARRFYSLSFPQPEGGVVLVTYPVKLSRSMGVVPPQPEDPVHTKLNAPPER